MREIPLTQGRVTLVDDSDYIWLNQWKWHAVSGGRSGLVIYAVRHIYPTRSDVSRKRKTIYMHKVIMDTDKYVRVIHRDKNTLNNQRDNLTVLGKGCRLPTICRRPVINKLKKRAGIPYRLPLYLQGLTPEQIVKQWKEFI